MQKGSVLGYDLNEKNCQISYYDENKEELLPRAQKKAKKYK